MVVKLFMKLWTVAPNCDPYDQYLSPPCCGAMVHLEHQVQSLATVILVSVGPRGFHGCVVVLCHVREARGIEV